MSGMTEVFDLTIIYADGGQHIVRNVCEYGYSRDDDHYYFVKNGYRGFIPGTHIRFIGRTYDYYNQEA